MKEFRFYREVLEEGEVKAGREFILEALQERFGPDAAAPFVASVSAVEDRAELSRLFRLAIRCSKLD